MIVMGFDGFFIYNFVLIFDGVSNYFDEVNSWVYVMLCWGWVVEDEVS